jgi:outer membrane protein
MKKYIKLFLFLLPVSGLVAQEKWDLKKSVEYALQNNISVRQADLQIRFAELDKKQSRLALYPNANLNGGVGYSAGRNQDPTSFSLITTGYWNSNYTLQASVDLFNWFTKRNNIAVKDLNYQAQQAVADKARNDVALNVAVAYLQILLAREQVNITKVQIEQTKAQLESTRKQVDAGRLPELNYVQLESQLATDSSNRISAETTVQQNILQLKALLNLDAAAPFDVDTPPVDAIPIESISDLQPESVYSLAIKNMPQQKVDELNLKSALKSVEVAKGAMYPTLSMFGSLGSAYNNKSQQAVSKTQVSQPLGKVNVGGTEYSVFPLQPFDVISYGYVPYFNQLDQNFRQSIGLSLNVPIFNGGSLRTGWQRSKLTVKQVALTKEQNSRTLKQDIYKAYNDATAAIQKFNANTKAVEAAQKSYDFARRRYDLGLLSTYELINTQSSLLQAKVQSVYSQYDFVFKMKLLEFYKGQGLKL